MGISHWASSEARTRYQTAYEAALELWVLPVERLQIPTAFGRTHVVASGAPNGSPIVLVHAASLSATQWHPQAAELGRTHRLFAVDIMGDIGLSTQTRPIHTRADAAAWLVSVIEGLGLERPIVMGSSFGAFQATNLAVYRPDRVGALVLLGPAATLKPFKRLANAFIRAGSLVPMPFTVRPGLRGMMEGGLPDERIVGQMELGVAGFRYDRAGIYPCEIPDAELAALRHPTLLMVGDRERIFDPRAAVARARRLFADIETELLPGVGHLPNLQRPEVVNQYVRRFLDLRFPQDAMPLEARPGIPVLVPAY